MSWDLVESVAKATTDSYSGPTSERELRGLIEKHPAACLLSLQTLEPPAPQRAVKHAMESVQSQWKDGYQNSAARLAPEVTAALATSAARTMPPIGHLPPGSWYLECSLRLAKDFFSKDETTFGVTENQIRRTRGLRELTIAGSGFKGAARSAFRTVHNDTHKDEEFRLFGPEKRHAEEGEDLPPDDDEEGTSRGKLVFCPTYIRENAKSTRLRILNPHSRKTKTGKNPIIYEVIRQGTDCCFQLLHMPWGWTELERAEHLAQVAADLDALGVGLQAMFRDLGAGAKTTSGFGTFKVLGATLTWSGGSQSGKDVAAVLSDAASAFRKKANDAN